MAGATSPGRSLASTEGCTSDGRLRPDRFLHRRVVAGRPVPVLRASARAVPGDAAPAPRRRGGLRLGGGQRRLPRPRHVLLVQLGDRAVRPVPGATRRRRRQRDHRHQSRPTPDERAHGHDGSARSHSRACAAHAAAHPAPPQAERGLHVAARGSAARRVPRPAVSANSSPPTPSRSRCWSSPTSSAYPSPTTNGSARGSAS